MTVELEKFDFFIQMHLTERCNLSCTHCYQAGPTPPEMSLPEITGAVKNIAGTIGTWSEMYDVPFSPGFNVTGGEPLLRADLEEILRVLSHHEFMIFLLTNGTLVNKDRARMLASIPVKGVQVSLEGPEGIHDIIRGRGSFASAFDGARRLVDAGIIVTFNVTLSQINAGYVPDLVDIARAAGVQRLGFSRLVPYGRGLNLVDRMLKPEEARSIYEKVLSYSVPGLEIVTGDPLASQLNAGSDMTDAGGFPLGGCAAAISGITVLPDGTLTPCRRLGMPIGNILKDNLREIWANSDVLNALRDKKAYTGKCSTCSRWARCRGCRAIAYAYSLSQGRNDLFEQDPQCWI
jgi:AdoMet-dependent heme synthase